MLLHTGIIWFGFYVISTKLNHTMGNLVMAQNQVVYTSEFKLHNVEFASGRIDLTPSVWIERNANFIGTPKEFRTEMAYSNPFDHFGLSRFHKELLASDVKIVTTHTAEQSEHATFDIDQCSFIALAISIIADYYFVVGIEEFKNNNNESKPSLGFYSSHFLGMKPGQSKISASEEAKLIEIYSFILTALRQSSFDNAKAKLLFLYSRCVVYTNQQQVTVLKLGLPPLLGDGTNTTVSVAMLLEHIFTREGDNWDEGIKQWNTAFPQFPVKQDDVDLIKRYRHITVHDNATRSQSKIDVWKKQNSLSDIESNCGNWNYVGKAANGGNNCQLSQLSNLSQSASVKFADWSLHRQY
jgi:hypothetical protein